VHATPHGRSLSLPEMNSREVRQWRRITLLLIVQMLFAYEKRGQR
jgi:hypothetical protein